MFEAGRGPQGKHMRQFWAGVGAGLVMLSAVAGAATVERFVKDMQLQGYVDAFRNQPVTGCPAIPAGIKGGGSYVAYVVKSYLKAVRDDFWPVEQDVQAAPGAASCPFHAKPSV